MTWTKVKVNVFTSLLPFNFFFSPELQFLNRLLYLLRRKKSGEDDIVGERKGKRVDVCGQG